MREGPDADDGWIMVEDEFHAIAKTFTQHLHHAEYVRLKEKAKRRSTFPVDVDPPTTDLALDIEQTPRQRKLRQRRVNEQGRTLESLLGNDERSTRTRMDDDLNKDEEDDPWVGTSLHGLMTSPHRPQRPLGDQSRSGSLVKPAKYAASTRSQGAPPRRKDVSGHEATYSTGPDEVQEHSSEASATDGPGDDDLELPATKMNRPGSSRVKSSRSGIDELCRRATVDSRAKPRQAVRLPMKLAAESGKDHSRKDEEKKPTPLQEIPTFLV
ncbi:MAG: hypothetical protein M1817_005321 [Caeruleum heppii]|nr:MAG: hypothetical protein M1817_005321 [Caeruleum heppii]